MQDKIIDFIRDYGNLNDMLITSDSKLTLDLGLSSFELIEMCCQIEEKFGIEISEENMLHIRTINDIVQICEMHSKKG